MKMSNTEIIEMFKQTLNFTNAFMSNLREEDFAKAVNAIYGREPDYPELDIQDELIKNATDLSTIQKIEYLNAITNKRTELKDKENERKKECADIVSMGSERKTKLAVKLALGIFTGGLSLLPDAYIEIEKALKD